MAASSISSNLARDCLLDVFVRLDPVSIIRCAAVCKHWRRVVIDNASEIRRHCRQSDRRALLGFHHRDRYPATLDFSGRSSWSPPAGGRPWDDLPIRPSNVPELDGIKTEHYIPLACSDGLLLIRRRFVHEEMFVCNPLTGSHVTVRVGELATHSYFLHSCHGDDVKSSNSSPDSFQLLAMVIEEQDCTMALQNYSSQSEAWGLVFRPKHRELRMPDRHFSAAPVACRGAVHWLCTKSSDYVTHTVAVDIGTGRARMARLPARSVGNLQALATTEGDDRLSLLRGGEASLSIWLYAGDLDVHGDDDEGEKSWVLCRSIDIRKLVEDAGLAQDRRRLLVGGGGSIMPSTRMEWMLFCPKSRHVILRMLFLGLFVLDLDNMEIQRTDVVDDTMEIWPFEIDFTLRFYSLKPFVQ